MEIIKELVGNKNNQSYNLLSEEEKNKLAFLNNSTPYGRGSPRLLLTFCKIKLPEMDISLLISHEKVLQLDYLTVSLCGYVDL